MEAQTLEIKGEKYHNAKKVAEMIGKSPGTLANWRAAKKGPKFTRFGFIPFYPETELVTWIESKMVSTNN